MAAVRMMIQMAEEMRRVAATVDRPEGVVQLIDGEYALLPELMRELSGAWHTMHVRATDSVTGDPLPPAVMDLIEQVKIAQDRIAEVTEDIAPLARRLMRDKLDALQDPRNRMWDHRANQGNAA